MTPIFDASISIAILPVQLLSNSAGVSPAREKGISNRYTLMCAKKTTDYRRCAGIMVAVNMWWRSVHGRRGLKLDEQENRCCSWS